MRNILFFETKEQAVAYQKQHKQYKRIEKSSTPMIAEDGKELWWTLIWTM